jgi:hypothetical protein
MGSTQFEDDIPLYGQRKLLGLRRRAQADLAAVPDAVFPGEFRDLGTERVPLLGA